MSAKSAGINVVWLRADLRVYDNPALFAAAQAGPCVAVYTLCTGQWAAHDVAPIKQALIVAQLKHLETALAKLNIPLVVLNCDVFSAVPDALVRWCSDLGAQALYCNLEYELNERKLTKLVKAELQAQGLVFYSYHDQCALAPGQIVTQQGAMYQVFTAFRKAYSANYQRLCRPIWPAPAPQAELGVASDLRALMPLEPLPLSPLWPAGEDCAHERLASFIEQRLSQYRAERDLPAIDATSALSPYLAVGILSTTQCFQALKSLSGGSLGSRNEGYITWMHELIWREFCRHMLWAEPRLCMHKAYKRATDKLPWRQDLELLQAWQQGRTGYPLVDAGMRQLNETGWMHNRVRMVTAMFLTKHLFLDWRLGERYFMQNLVDGDLASNNGGWQWSASTGVDAAPYFRIFNPERQSERFDPEGEYIKRYVPELACLNNKQIHNPSDELRRKLNYPKAIVEHRSAVAETKAAFAALNVKN